MNSAPALPQAPDLPSEDRTPALVMHLSPLLGYLLPTFGHLLGPALAWLLWRDKSAALDDQGKEVLNFQLSLTLYSFVISGIIFMLFAFGLLGGLLSGVLGMGSATTSGDPGPMFAGLFGTVLGIFGPFAAFFALLIPGALLLSLFPLVAMLIAVNRASQGQGYRYPLTIRFLR